MHAYRPEALQSLREFRKHLEGKENSRSQDNLYIPITTSDDGESWRDEFQMMNTKFTQEDSKTTRFTRKSASPEEQELMSIYKKVSRQKDIYTSKNKKNEEMLKFGSAG